MADASHAAQGLAFFEPLVLLAAAVAGVSLSRRLGLGSVLGYLAAGVAVGPLSRLITGGEDILNVAQLGIVLFLFIIGLELKPARLWSMWSDIFGLGLAQVVLTGAILTGVFWALGWAAPPALIIGFGLAMSSTALGMQILGERNELTTEYGQKATAILLFQDLAVVPLLALVPLLAPGGGMLAADSGVGVLKGAAAVAALVLAGRYLLNPLFRLLALTGGREVMTAAALLVVLGAAALMEAVGLSMAMGAFLAGLMLADSAFRHELQADIEPFRSILLGLFFISVGMSINVDSIIYSWWRIALAVPVVMAVKSAVLYGLARVFKASRNDAIRVALLLPQAGEFAFVLFASAAAVRALWPSETSIVAGIVTVTIAATPFSLMLSRYLIRPENEDVMEEDFEGAGGSVLVIGFGRFGQIVSQILLARHIDATVIDADAERVRQASRFGFRIYFGDGGRRDVLRAAGADQASIICICVDRAENASRIADLVLEEFRSAKVFVRSWDRAHTLELLARGVDYEIRETYESALRFGAETLRSLGVSPSETDDLVAEVRRRDADRLAEQQSGRSAPGRPSGPREVTPEPLSPVERPRPRDGERRARGEGRRPRGDGPKEAGTRSAAE